MMSLSKIYDKNYFNGKTSNYKGGYKYEVYYPFHKAVAEGIFEIFKPRKILDVGCAMGYLVKAFQELGVDACGIDISEYAIKNGVVRNLILGDATSIPFKDGSFDLVIALDLIEHLKNPEEFISEVYRILKPNRYFVVKTCSPSSKDAKADPTHVTILTEKEWETMFKRFNFVRLKNYEREIRRKIAYYYARKEPTSLLGKVLNVVKVRRYAILFKELYIQPRYDYYFVLRRD
ncbi:MAG TPA: class I SAM-dependent methyltransferase [Bacteroidia bacterium]|nr:class I SAM-dependent methyltransferase [Bacteroidia bacterium]